MRKLIIVLCIFLINQNIAIGTTVDLSDENALIKNYAKVVANEVAVASTATVHSDIWEMPNSDYHGYWIICTGVSVDLKVYIQGSYINTTGPMGQWGDKETNAEIINITDTAIHIDNMTLMFAVYGRLKIVGQLGNGADTTITIVIFRDTKQK